MAAKQLIDDGLWRRVTGDDCSMGYEPKNACLIRKRALHNRLTMIYRYRYLLRVHVRS